MMDIRNDRLFERARAADHDQLAALQETLARCGMACAHLLAAWGGGAEGAAQWEDGDGGPARPEAMLLLGRSAWIGELNAQLAMLTAMQHRILPRLADRAKDRELARRVEQASASLWASGGRWGVSLCRLLRRILRRPQSVGGDAGSRARLAFASAIALQQLHELLIHALRWRMLCGIIHPGMPGLPVPASLESELTLLEKAWLEARFPGVVERRAILRQIGLLRHWLASVRERRVGRLAFARRQTMLPRPWLNRMVRAGVSG